MTEISTDDFRAEVTAFLDAHASVRPDATEFVWGEGNDDVALFEELTPDEEARQLAEAKAWLGTRAAADLHWISGPTELGGRGLPRSYEQIYRSLESRYEVPKQGFFGIGLGMVAPTIAAHGTAETKQYLPKMYSGELVGCQLFSEPGAGSDLAGLQTKAERDGDEWVVTGQKVWTSGAHYSDIGEIICRTDPDLPKHWRAGGPDAPPAPKLKSKNKTLVSMGHMAFVVSQIGRMGKGQEPAPKASPLFALIGGQLARSGQVKRYRAWLSAQKS